MAPGQTVETHDPDLVEFIRDLQAWHQRQVSQLEEITAHKDAGIKLGDREIPAGSDLAKGVRIGVMIGLQFLGKLPFSAEETGPETEEGDG